MTSPTGASPTRRSGFSVAGWGLVAALTALLAALAYAAHGTTSTGLITLLDLWLLLAISVVDISQGRIPNRLLALAVLLVAAASLVFRQPPPLSALLGGCTGLAAFLLLARVRPGGLGMGDVKLAAVIGLMVGFPQVVFALLLGVIAGGLVALALWLSRRVGRGQTMVYGPYLAIGACMMLLIG